MRPLGRKVTAAISVGAVLALGIVVLVGRRRHHRTTGEWFGGSWTTTGWFEQDGPDDDSDAGPEIADAAIVAWCAEGLEAIPGGGCLALPGPATGGPGSFPLVVYLHGIFDPAEASEELARQARVAAHGVAKGFAVLALRGHVGQCSAPEYAARVCWPSNERNQDAGPSYVDEWKAPLAIAGRRGAGGRRYVLGFSNGGYFSGLLAERAWFSAAGFVVSRGGPVAPVKAAGAKAPLLLTLSEGDPSHDEMMKLDEELRNDDWPHERFVSQGGHALPDADVEAAIAFFAKIEGNAAAAR